MDWKNFLKPNLFKILFIISVILVFGVPYTYQFSTYALTTIPESKLKRENPVSFAEDLASQGYGPHGEQYYGLLPFWSNWGVLQSQPSMFKFSFSIIYFILMLLLLYLLSCFIFAVYGTIDKNSNTAGRLYSRIGIILFAIIVVAWKLSVLSEQLFGFRYRQVTGILILATWIVSIAMMIVGIIGYRKQDRLASIIIILISIIAALYGFFELGSLWVSAML